MPDIYILFTVLLLPTGLFVAVYSFFIKEKLQRTSTFISGIILLIAPILILIGDFFNRIKLKNLGIPIFLSLICLFLFFWNVFIYKSCTFAVQATCKGLITFTTRHTRHISTPEFQYSFNGETITRSSIFSDHTVALNWRFLKGRTYTVYINPKEPTICSHENHFPKRFYGALILGIIFLLISVAIIIFL